jgi:hypothetical protein
LAKDPLYSKRSISRKGKEFQFYSSKSAILRLTPERWGGDDDKKKEGQEETHAFILRRFREDCQPLQSRQHFFERAGIRYPERFLV